MPPKPKPKRKEPENGKDTETPRKRGKQSVVFGPVKGGSKWLPRREPFTPEEIEKRKNLKQGDPDWKRMRVTGIIGASDTGRVLGYEKGAPDSPDKTLQKRMTLTPEEIATELDDNEFLQQLFKHGHTYEPDARDILQEVMCADIVDNIGQEASNDDPVFLAASPDGTLWVRTDEDETPTQYLVKVEIKCPIAGLYQESAPGLWGVKPAHWSQMAAQMLKGDADCALYVVYSVDTTQAKNAAVKRALADCGMKRDDPGSDSVIAKALSSVKKQVAVIGVHRDLEFEKWMVETLNRFADACEKNDPSIFLNTVPRAYCKSDPEHPFPPSRMNHTPLYSGTVDQLMEDDTRRQVRKEILKWIGTVSKTSKSDPEEMAGKIPVTAEGVKYYLNKDQRDEKTLNDFVAYIQCNLKKENKDVSVADHYTVDRLTPKFLCVNVSPDQGLGKGDSGPPARSSVTTTKPKPQPSAPPMKDVVMGDISLEYPDDVVAELLAGFIVNHNSKAAVDKTAFSSTLKEVRDGKHAHAPGVRQWLSDVLQDPEKSTILKKLLSTKAIPKAAHFPHHPTPSPPSSGWCGTPQHRWRNAHPYVLVSPNQKRTVEMSSKPWGTDCFMIKSSKSPTATLWFHDKEGYIYDVSENKRVGRLLTSDKRVLHGENEVEFEDEKVGHQLDTSHQGLIGNLGDRVVTVGRGLALAGEKRVVSVIPKPSAITNILDNTKVGAARDAYAEAHTFLCSRQRGTESFSASGVDGKRNIAVSKNSVSINGGPQLPIASRELAQNDSHMIIHLDVVE